MNLLNCNGRNKVRDEKPKREPFLKEAPEREKERGKQKSHRNLRPHVSRSSHSFIEAVGSLKETVAETVKCH